MFIAFASHIERETRTWEIFNRKYGKLCNKTGFYANHKEAKDTSFRYDDIYDETEQINQKLPYKNIARNKRDGIFRLNYTD